MKPPPDSRWTILRVTRPGGHSNSALARVRCECGTEKVIQLDGVLTGHTRSCGCLMRELAGPRLAAALTTHGDSKARLYRLWRGMRERCNYPRHKSYHRYGGRGIRVAPQWDDYVVFRKWALENGYEDGLTIDRIDNDGNYEPDNCRWITRADNIRRYASLPRKKLPHQRDEAAQKMEAILG